MKHNTQISFVTLVGAGCGPGLITLDGLSAVRQADVLIYDDLIDSGLLNEAPEGAEKIHAGKRFGVHSMKQEEINRLLIEKARKGLNAVRLKGGDSFVFGRGGEECLALKAAGIPFRVIPGVSSAIAVPENAGIPVTHRAVARSFTVLTGKTADGTEINYKALVNLHGTLVFLMGVHEISNITDGLIREGMPPGTPAAVISKGFSPDEARINGTVENIAERAEGADTPAVIVVGDTAAFDLRPEGNFNPKSDKAGSIKGYSESAGKPEAGKAEIPAPRVIITGTEAFIKRAEQSLAGIGAKAYAFPTLMTEQYTGRVPNDFSGYGGLVFTSPAGIETFFKALRERRLDIRTLRDIHFACIGPATAKELETYGIYPDLVPDTFSSEALGEALVQKFSENKRKFLILRSENGSSVLTDILDKAGIAFDEVGIYRTVPIEKKIPLPECDFLVFGSAGGVRAYAGNYNFSNDFTYVCIGNTTAKELRSHTDYAFLTAEKATAESIAEIIERNWKKI